MTAPAGLDTRDDDRHKSPYSAREKAGRLLWAAAQATVFRLSFHSQYRWRAWLLRRFGARLEHPCFVRRTVRIECPWQLSVGANSAVGDRAELYCLGPVSIGRRVTISQRAHVCAGSHDFDSPEMPLLRPPVDIGDDAWIATDAFVGPGVSVGEGVILGARACAFKDLEAWTIYGGNPATPIGKRKKPRAAGPEAEPPEAP